MLVKLFIEFVIFNTGPFAASPTITIIFIDALFASVKLYTPLSSNVSN
jgi:hypothetical protein